MTAVGVGSSISHGENTCRQCQHVSMCNQSNNSSRFTWSSVLELEVLILKLVAIDGLAASAVVIGEITTLAHELGDDAVES